MPSFQEDFAESKGAPIIYNGMELIGMDRVPVEKKFSGTLKLISTNSEYKQAVCLRVNKGKMKVGEGELEKGKIFVIWEEYLKDGLITFEGVTKDLELLVYNAWEQILWTGQPFTARWMNGAAMIVEVNGNTRLYKCNDGHPDDNFDDIIFEVTINE